MSVLPAGILGIWAGRWACKQAGPFETTPGAPGTLQPGFSHAIAIYLAAEFGSGLIGSILGDASRATIAKIACLSYGGDLFMRRRFMMDSKFVKENLSLEGEALGNPASNPAETFVDAAGNRYIKTASGWQLAGLSGMESRSVIGEPETQVIELPADITPEELDLYGVAVDRAAIGEVDGLDGRRRRRYLSGMESESAIGALSSFGY